MKGVRRFAFGPIAERMRWLARGDTGASAVIQTVFARFGMLSANVLTGVIVARTLLPMGRGELAAIAVWPTLFGSFLSLGLPLSTLYNIKRDPASERNFFSTSLVSLLILSSIAALIGAAILPLTLHKYSSDFVRAAQFMMIFTIQILIQYLLQATFEARGRFDVSNQLRFIPLVITIVSLATLAALHALNPIRAALCYSVPPTLLTLVCLWKLRDLFPIDLRRWRLDLASLLPFGLKSYGTDLMNTFSSQIEQGLLVGLLSPASLGLFTVASSLSNMLRIFQASFSVVLMPRATEMQKVDEIVDLTARATRISSFATLLAALALTVVLPPAINVLYGHNYAHSAIVARVLMIDVLLQGAVTILSQAFVALGRPATMTIFQLAGISTSAPLLLMLTPRYGLTGAAIAFALSSTVRLAFAVASYPMLLHHRIPHLLLTRDDIRFVRSRLVMRGAPRGTK